MKKIFYLLTILVLPFFGCSQTNYNELTKEQYYNITFSNVKLSYLLESERNITDLSNSFGLNLTDVTHPQNDEGNDYDSTGMSISYFENELGGIEVKNSNIIININGVNVRIGSNMSLLGYGKIGSRFKSFLNPNNNNKRIATFKPEYNDTYISVRFNSQTGLIEEIRYMSPT